MKKPLVLIAGPTASGKTSSSVCLAKKLDGEIISADSMQVYKGMDIGTAKVKPEEMEGIPHYMLDECLPAEGCDIAFFKEKVQNYIAAIHAKGKVPILVGGTGFYINAILFDTEFEETNNDFTLRENLFALAEKEGVEKLHKRLERVDPISAKAIHPNNVKRVIRALEYYEQTGLPISSHNEKEKSKRLENSSPYDYTFFALTMKRETLYSRINQRVDQMLSEGLVEEVRSFYEAGLREDAVAMKAIGYKEFFPYFRGEASLENCVLKLKQHTRNYAKRQLTWLKHQANPHFIEVDQYHFDTSRITEVMLSYLGKLTKKESKIRIE
ncbi:tRNA (adenosine(37)-N6)-dimethylallyltransferase MiaA [Sporanaerobium hydrogeniformans]|uniref:tRNA (Adenosine(37)-N6)-dimethylallyltransferase MiaA n=1 Tax=Sporanaerobium hydrogeniformans TaxID=3072179 RepID=A0AC61DDC5_9FIRM|nr:tRNA (adenosine(37)-N6)-dimethylallyltransferase MiaA [Sporanaerobium hydrogeniformans]PHV70736.1 tRNA (adenosine(37)-N6)-dimethylallyltransferase MiaA [Sporanaerobium hydrogeniformans]